MKRTNQALMKKALPAVLAAALIPAGIFGSVSPAAAVEDEAGHEKDYRTFHTDGKIDFGKVGDSYTAELVMYLAGNQFMVMEELIKDFQSKNPGIKTIYVETIPPGQILKGQILAQGEVNGQKTAQNPDLFASVNENHLKQLITKKKADNYMIYTRNKLELMVKKGNPKNIKGVEDLGRDDIVQSHPNPITEGIFKFYGSEMLKDLNLHAKVTGGKECKECWAVPGKTWFTARHHRETPYRIENGEADVGIVWTTEVKYAVSQGRKVEGISIPAPYNKQEKVGYAIGRMNDGRNKDNAAKFLAYLATDDAQSIYEKYGFLRASKEDLAMR